MAGRCLPIVAISVILLLPCFWHRHIEAGDLASHTYNAWLAQLIGQETRLGFIWCGSGITFWWTWLWPSWAWFSDLPSAEKIVVSACVLIFFWGAFGFIAAATCRLPWFLVPAIAMIAYGWTFEMGFMNYYLSLGFGFFAAALFWRGQAVDWIAAFFLSGLTLMAHPMGFLSLVGIVMYIRLAEKSSGWFRWVVLASAFLAVLGLHWYIVRHFRVAYWDTPFFYLLNGADQLVLYGNHYLFPAWIALIFGSGCFIHGRVQQRKRGEPVWSFRTALELWLILLFVAAMIPELIYLPRYAAPIGFPVVRLTAVTGILGLCILGSVQPRRWHFAGLSAMCDYFFRIPLSRHWHPEQNGGSDRGYGEDFALRPPRHRNNHCSARFEDSFHQPHGGSGLHWTMFHVFQLQACVRAVPYSRAFGQPLGHGLSGFFPGDGRREVCSASARSPYDADRSVRRE